MINAKITRENKELSINLSAEGKIGDLEVETAMIVTSIIDQISKISGVHKDRIVGGMLIELFKKLEGDPHEINRD